MTFDLDRIEESKKAMRKKLASTLIDEKMRLMDLLHEQAVAIKKARESLKKAKPEQKGA